VPHSTNKGVDDELGRAVFPADPSLLKQAGEDLACGEKTVGTVSPHQSSRDCRRKPAGQIGSRRPRLCLYRINPFFSFRLEPGPEPNSPARRADEPEGAPQRLKVTRATEAACSGMLPRGFEQDPFRADPRFLPFRAWRLGKHVLNPADCAVAATRWAVSSLFDSSPILR
jgi:hypothetical protein